MRLSNAKDFWSGVTFILTGIFFILALGDIEVGTAAHMGPGYFPMMLGGLLALVGALLLLRGMLGHRPPDGGRLSRFHPRVFFLILGSVLVFSLLLPYLGLVLAIAALVIISSLADSGIRPLGTLIAIVVLCAIVWLVFVYGIGMIVPVWPIFLG